MKEKIRLELDWLEIREILDKHIKSVKGYDSKVKLFYEFFDFNKEYIDLQTIIANVED